MRTTGSYAATAEPKGHHFVMVAVLHVPAGVAVYEGGDWRATFRKREDADDFAGLVAQKPWRVLA